MKQAVLFLIPARGGSKGFPGKNIARLAGIPIVGRAARVAGQAASVLGPGCRVVCSTDDPAIAEAAFGTRRWSRESFVVSTLMRTLPCPKNWSWEEYFFGTLRKTPARDLEQP